MSWLDRIISVIREPLDQMKDWACEKDVNSSACGAFSSLSERMGGTQTQKLILSLDTIVKEAIAEVAARRTAMPPPLSQRMTIFQPLNLDTLFRGRPTE